MAMIEAAEREGRIEPGRTTIVEATSGNTGIALAFVCAAKGYELVLTLPQGMSREREALLRLYGARVEVIESLGGMDEAVDAARRLAARRRRLPARPVLQPRQPGDPPPHARPPRSWTRLDGRVDVFVAGVGTGGHDHRRRRGPQGAQPRAPASSRSSRRARRSCRAARPGPHKIQGIGAGFVPRCSTATCIDEIMRVDDEDAIETARLLARTRGRPRRDLLRRRAVGRARGRRAAPSRAGKRIVTMLPDSGERYVSTPFFAPPLPAAARA